MRGNRPCRRPDASEPARPRRRRQASDRDPQHQSTPDHLVVDREDFPARLVCARCRTVITSTAQYLEMNGSHRHVFDNPAGLRFEIGCFREAAGCVTNDPPMMEFTWFPGFAWQIAYCLGCKEHLGWQYTGKRPARFFGLILDRLVREKAPDPG